MSFCTVDLSQWRTGDAQARAACVAAFHRAVTTLGFFVLTGHGEPLNAMQAALQAEATAFFTSPLPAKMQLHHGPYGHPQGGYHPLGTESVAKSIGLQQKDTVESMIFTRQPSAFVMPAAAAIPAAAAAPAPCVAVPFQTTADRYYASMVRVLRLVHDVASASLQLPPAFHLDTFYFDCPPEAGENGNILKVSFYPATSADARSGSIEGQEAKKVGSEGSVRLRYGAHTDYQGFTLLKPDATDWCPLPGGGTTGGLEMFSPVTKTWVAVKPPAPQEGHDVLVVNVGDLLRVWSNDAWHSPLHRVRGPSPIPSSSSSPPSAAAAAEGHRCAIVFFSGPCYNTLVQPLGGRDPPKYAPIGAGEHLMRKIKASQVAVAAPSNL